jgi:class 3 adenylate cyclase
VRVQKELLVSSTTMMASLAVIWSGLYAAFGAIAAAAIPLAYAAASFASLLVFARVRRYQLFRLSQLVLSLLLPFFLMLSLGGFAASSAVVLWSLTSPLGALVFAGRRPATGWFGVYLLLVAAGALLGQGRTNDLPDGVVMAFFVMNIAGVSLVAFILLQYFVGERDLAVTILDREHRWIKDAFSRYISPNLVRHLIEHPEQLRLGGERRECTFVLSDLAGFTALVEQAEPEIVVMLLNEYLEGMTRIALEAEGTLDRIVGDAVAVMFSAPVAQPDHAARALRCALEMDAFASAFTARVSREHAVLRGTRIGVCSGPVIVGHFGSRDRLDYRALGDAINTASRLENANRYFGTRICVASETVARVPGFTGRRIGMLQLPGKRTLVEAWEPLVPAAPDAHWAEAYEDAYEQMARRDPGVLDALRDLEQAHPGDPLVRFHLGRIAGGEEGVVVNLAARARAETPALAPVGGGQPLRSTRCRNPAKLHTAT